MRMIYTVIDQIWAAVPESEQEHYGALYRELEQVKEMAAYKAPEQMPPYFRMTSNLLEKYLGEPDTDWKRIIADIFADRLKGVV